jgi:VanZ family protein
MHSRHLLLLILISIIVITIGAFISDDVHKILLRAIEIDSIGHFLSFFALTWLLNSLLKFPLLNLSICLIFYAALTEIGQFYLGFRNGEISDFLADVVGISLFVFIKWSIIVYGGKKQQ